LTEELNRVILGDSMPDLSELLGESRAIEAVRDTVRKLLARQQPGRRLPAILIQGETGTGKGVVAHLIHRMGPRARGRFVDVNCAAIPETLLEAELFGFERGAFTDARRAKAGLFQAAHRGSIFLDEVGLLPEPLQAKLLTVIEEQAVRRLGSTQSEPADAWIISATNADLGAAIRERRFREDLYHRLAVLTLRLPPLREREGDVLLLADRFLARACADYGLPPKTLAPGARQQLMAYPWPGNVRELSNVIERAALLSDGATVTAEWLALGETVPLPAGAAAGGASATSPAAAAAVSMDDAVREHLSATLERTGWNLSRTAALLGMARNTLRARIEKFGLRRGTDAAAPRRRAPEIEPAEARPPASTPATTEAGAAAPAARRGPAAGTIRWERRRLTLVRAALVLSDASDMQPDTSRALEVMIDKVQAFGGRVEEVGQAGIDASFGLEPIEDAPRRAANAALAILNAAGRARGAGAETPALRIAMHSGSYLVGQISGAPQIDQVAKREADTIVEGLISAAAPDSVVLSATTVPFLERRFELVPVRAAAGSAEPIYRLAGRDGTGLGLWGRMGKFFGRRHELELLKSRWALAARGHGQLVGLVGEPGVGKSRLLWEFVHSEDAGQWLLLETAAVALGTPTPYLPFTDLLKHYFELEGGEDADRARERISDKLLALEPGLATTLPALLALLDVPFTDDEWRSLDPPQRRRRTLYAVKHLLLCESRRQPVALVIEDAHWVDGETQALLDSLVDGLPMARVLLLLTYRPEYQHPWGGKSFYTQLRVDPLLPDTAAELLDDLLGRQASLQLLKPRLVEWTEGNPFFLEESVRTLVETGALAGGRGAYELVRPVASIQVPGTVEDVLAARIDRLADEQRRLLQSAAVIGKDVPYPILAAIADLPEEELGESLRQLQAAEFLYETHALPEMEYTFKHALTHEVTYGSVAQGKRALHARILEIMEALYADRRAEHVDQLAHHAFRGHVWEKALAYQRLAGVRALARSANREAAAFFEQALEALQHLPERRETQEQGVDLRVDLRNALTPLGEVERTLEHLRAAAALAERLGDQRRLGRAYSFATNCLYLVGRHHDAVQSGHRARAIADALDDFPLRTATDMYLGRAHQALGEYERAIGIFQRIVTSLTGDPAREHLGLPVLPAVFSRSHLIVCLAEIGDFPEAARRAEEAMSLAEATTHPDTLLWAYRGAGQLHLAQGNWERAATLLGQALGLCRTHDIPVYIPGVDSDLGLAHAMSGRMEEGFPLLERAVEQAAARKQIVLHAWLLLQRAEGHLLANQLSEAAGTAEQALRLFQERGERAHEAHALRVLADVSRQQGGSSTDEALTLYGRAGELAGARSMRPLTARCLLGLGLLHDGRKETAKAREHFEAAAALFEQMAMPFWLDRARAGLDASARGDRPL